MNRRTGLTLIELLLSMVIAGTLTAALARAYAVGAGLPARSESSRAQIEDQVRFESALRETFEHAYLSTDTGSTTSYFLAGADATGETGRLTFTRFARQLQGPQIASDAAFEDRNSRFGTAGGLIETSVGPTPVGSDPQGEGIYVRTQQPSDGDFEQGGRESALGESLVEWNVELFDGANWIVDWDTRVGQRRLPSAIRISYRMNDADELSSITIRLKHSDITPENPLQTETGGTGT